MTVSSGLRKPAAASPPEAGEGRGAQPGCVSPRFAAAVRGWARGAVGEAPGPARHCLTALTIDQARTLLGEAVLQAWAGPVGLPRAGDQPLVDWLVAARPECPWLAALRGMWVDPLDVNLASGTQLSRLPGVSQYDIDILMAARPFLSMNDFRLTTPTLAALADRAGEMLGHPGYRYPGRHGAIVSLRPYPRGLVLTARGPIVDVDTKTLARFGLRALHRDESWLAALWDDRIGEPSPHLARLKSAPWVDRLAPIFCGPGRDLLANHPLQIRMRLADPGASLAVAARRLGLRAVRAFGDGDGIVQLAAARHDLSALYRTLFAMRPRRRIRLAEPAFTRLPGCRVG